MVITDCKCGTSLATFIYQYKPAAKIAKSETVPTFFTSMESPLLYSPKLARRVSVRGKAEERERGREDRKRGESERGREYWKQRGGRRN
jgi:hypothetical protein